MQLRNQGEPSGADDPRADDPVRVGLRRAMPGPCRSSAA